LFNYTKAELSEIANKQNFIQDTLEKVVRLSEVLDYINSNPIMKGCLALKGGAAIMTYTESREKEASENTKSH